MRRFFPVLLLLSLCLLFVASCSNKSTSYDETDELVRFNAYRQLHYPESRKLSENAFMQTLKSNPAGETIKSGSWLYFNYWAVNLDGTYLGTNIPERARAYNQYSQSTFYALQYKEMSAEGIGSDIFEALKDAHIGDEIVIGLTATKAKALGLWTNADHTSALFYIRPYELIADPEKHEETLIADYLTKNTGFEKHDSVYRKIVEVGTGSEIKKTTTIWVQYEIYSLSGYLFDTNVADVAQLHGIYSSSKKYTLLSFKASEDSKLIRGFSGLTVGLKTGTKLRAVIPSALAYKKTGRGTIRPYEPLVVSMSIVRASKSK